MRKIISFFLPRDKVLYDLFKEISNVAFETSIELSKLLDNYSKIERQERKSKASILAGSRQRAEDINKRILERLSSAKIDHDKLLLEQLSIGITQVCRSQSSICLYLSSLGIEMASDDMIKFVKLAVNSIKDLNNCITKLKNPSSVRENCLAIHKMEKEADELYHHSISELFHFYKNSMDALKYTKMYDSFDDLMNKVDECANMIERL